MRPFFLKRAKGVQPNQSDHMRESPTYRRRSQLSQILPPSPKFTASNITFQKGRVFLVTGGTSGIGFELAKVLYSKGGIVYITGRTVEKAKKAVQEIQSSTAEREGQIRYIVLKLDDLASIKESVEAFKEQESKLDVLWNNAGVAMPPSGTLSTQGYEIQLATNCLGPFLFTQMMIPFLDAAVAQNGPTSPGSVRVVWLSSQVAELNSPAEGIIMSELNAAPKNSARSYQNSKLGNWFLSSEFARRYGDEHSIISVAMNPGPTRTKLLSNARWSKMLRWPVLNHPHVAALTALYAGLSPDINLGNNGCYVIPMGRIHTKVAPHLLNAMRDEEVGGTGRAKQFWEYCDDKTKGYR